MPESLHDRLRQRIAELNLTPERASRQAGLDKTYLRKLFERPGANPGGASLQKLATALEVSSDWLLTGAEPPDGAPMPLIVAQADKDFRRADVHFPEREQLDRTIEVIGTAAGSIIHENIEGFELGSRVENVRRPPALVGVDGAYAIYVTGDSMDPMHPQGALRFAIPGRPPQPGDSVIVLTRTWDDDPGQAYIKIYRRRAGGFYIFEQINPVATFKVPEEYVISIHKVPTMNELFGV